MKAVGKRSAAGIKGLVYKQFLQPYSWLLKMARGTQFAYWRCTNFFRMALCRGRCYSADTLLWVDPRMTTHCTAISGSKYTIRGKVAGGDWDLKTTRFEDWDVYRAFWDRFTRGIRWEQTEYYRRVAGEIENGRVKWGLCSKEDFDRRLRTLESLYDRIVGEGFKSQREIAEQAADPCAWEPDSHFNRYDDVIVCIGRHGDLLFRDGKHRLAITKVLGLERIPVAVGFRHRQWHVFRRKILAHAAANGGMLDYPLTHPDLRDIRAFGNNDLFQRMIEHLSTRKGRVLDLAAGWGTFCHWFEEAGFQCTAVENDQENLYFLRKLRRAQRRHFQVVEGSVLEMEGELKFDIVLAIGIAERYLKTEAAFNSFLEMLRRIETDVLFIEIPSAEQFAAIDASWHPAPQDLANAILAQSPFGEASLIGQGRRPMAAARSIAPSGSPWPINLVKKLTKSGVSSRSPIPGHGALYMLERQGSVPERLPG